MVEAEVGVWTARFTETAGNPGQQLLPQPSPAVQWTCTRGRVWDSERRSLYRTFGCFRSSPPSGDRLAGKEGGCRAPGRLFRWESVRGTWGDELGNTKRFGVQVPRHVSTHARRTILVAPVGLAQVWREPTVSCVGLPSDS